MADESTVRETMARVEHYAQRDWKEYVKSATPAGLEPQNAFFVGYAFGTGLGLAMSRKIPEFAGMIAQVFNARDWDASVSPKPAMEPVVGGRHQSRRERAPKGGAAMHHEPAFGNMMEGIAHYAEREWNEYLKQAMPADLEPEKAFVDGYALGTVLGLALSRRMPELVEVMVKVFDEDNWEPDPPEPGGKRGKRKTAAGATSSKKKPRSKSIK